MKYKNKLAFALTLSFILFFSVIYGYKILEKQQDYNKVNTQITSTSQEIYIPQKQKDISITLNYKNEVLLLNKNNLKPSQLLEVALLSGSDIKGTLDILLCKGYNLERAFCAIYSNWEELLNNFFDKIETKPKESEITFNPSSKNNFEYSNSEDGFMCNKDKLYTEIYSNILNNKINIDVELEKTKPLNTIETNKKKTREISHFITDLSTSKAGRHHNVTLALKSINGLVVKSGETISFNKVIGSHSADNGYKKSIIIENGEFVEGVGGGICQASSTLYNALLLANMKIKEVHKHTIPVRYVKLGLDAMVAEGWADLVFENTSKDPIYIKAFTDKESAYVYIYGNSLAENEKIERRNEIVKTIPIPSPKIVYDTKGQYASKVIYEDESYTIGSQREGYEVNAYLDYYKDGKLINSEKIRHEIYKPQAKTVVKGTKARPIVDNEENEDLTEETFSNYILENVDNYEGIYNENNNII